MAENKSTGASSNAIEVVDAQIDSTGRLLVPAKIRRQLNWESGSQVRLSVSKGVLQVESLDQAIARVQAIAKKRISRKDSLVESLIEDRRREAARE